MSARADYYHRGEGGGGWGERLARVFLDPGGYGLLAILSIS